MKKVVVMMALMLVAFSGTAMALPIWWDSPVGHPIHFSGGAGGTGYINPGDVVGSVFASGTLDNELNRQMVKQVYVVLDYSIIDENGEYELKTGTISGAEGPFGVPMTLVVNEPGRLEYTYFFTYQPSSEFVSVEFANLHPNDSVQWNMQIQSWCSDGQVAEPASLLLMVGGIAGIARRKRS